MWDGVTECFSKCKKNIYKMFHTFFFAVHTLLYGEYDRGNVDQTGIFWDTQKLLPIRPSHISINLLFSIMLKKNAATQIILMNRENFVVVRQGESSWQTRSFTLGFVCQNSLILLNTKKVPVVLSAIWNLLRYGGMGKQGDALRMGDMSVSC